jgi:CheY-like chemotaxis protein
MTKTSPQELGSLVVLIVEDEFFLRCDLADCLRDAGWVVMEAATADHAMAMCRDEMALHVLITDIQLNASTSGWDAAEAFRALSSDIAVIYPSAYSGDRTRFRGQQLAFR